MNDTKPALKRLTGLLAECHSPVIVESLGEPGDPGVALEINATCPDDEVCHAPPEVREADGSIPEGPWNRRNVRLRLVFSEDSSDPVLLRLTYSTKDADADGDRIVEFNWEFKEGRISPIAEMALSDSKTYKVDYFSLLPPPYASQFVNVCERAYRGGLLTQ